MSDLALLWRGWDADCALAAADLAREDDLETAVILSLMLDARARDDDALPDSLTDGAARSAERATGDRRGWWADSAAPASDGDRTGSRLWLLCREKTLPEVLRRAKDYAEEALAWMIADGTARAVNVTAGMPRQGLLALHITITLPDGSTRNINVQRSV